MATFPKLTILIDDEGTVVLQSYPLAIWRERFFYREFCCPVEEEKLFRNPLRRDPESNEGPLTHGELWQ